jgi:hypothetical protein
VTDKPPVIKNNSWETEKPTMIQVSDNRWVRLDHISIFNYFVYEHTPDECEIGLLGAYSCTLTVDLKFVDSVAEALGIKIDK